MVKNKALILVTALDTYTISLVLCGPDFSFYPMKSLSHMRLVLIGFRIELIGYTHCGFSVYVKGTPAI